MDKRIGERGGVSGVASPTMLKGDVASRLNFSGKRKLPVLRQSEAAECGLVCLAMILGYYGQHHELRSLRQRFPISLKGINLSSLIDMANSLGLSSRPLRVEIHELGQVKVPCVLHWDMNHFVVLREIRASHVLIHDPATGERRIPFDKLKTHFTGIAVELARGPDFRRKAPDPPLPLRKLAGSVEGLPKALLTVFSLALALELFALLMPQFLQIIVDQVISDGDKDLLTFIGFSFSLLVIIQAIVSAMRTWTVLWVGTNFNLSWTGNVFEHLLRLPHPYFLKRHLGDVVSRFGAISSIQHTLTTRFVETILDGLMAILTLVVLLAYSPLLAALTAGSVAIYAALRVLYYSVYREANIGQIAIQAKQQSDFMESIRGVLTLRLFNQVPARSARYLNLTTDSLNAGIAVQRLSLTFSSLQALIAGLQRIGVLWLGARFALDGKMSSGMLIAFAAYADQFSGRATSLVDYALEIKLLRIQGERLADIVLSPRERYSEGCFVGPPPTASVRFDSVSYRYGPGEDWVIKDCSFEIAEGDSVAVVGPSGSGKTTLVSLMLGLLDPEEGRICIGGLDLKHLGKDRYRSFVGCVLQDSQLFAGSIADNISCFAEDADIERIQIAARDAQLHDDIVSMPMGYHTLVGDMGSTLSGGQKQRLSLARALYRSPKILVLDEATSHLDVLKEQKILDTLRCKKITRISVAHRKETICAARRVLRVERGQITDCSSEFHLTRSQFEKVD